MASTIDLSFHFLDAPHWEAGDAPFLLYTSHTPSMEDGYAETQGQLWSEDGRLIARARQMVAVFAPPRVTSGG